MFFFKGCENQYNYHIAQQFKMIESRGKHSGDIEKVMNKSFLERVSSHSTSNLTTQLDILTQLGGGM